MFDGAYRRRLTRDLPVWRDRGWVTPTGVDAILVSLAERRSPFGMAAIVGLLGALLVGLGVIVFVSANWQAMPRLLRFGVLIAGMAAAYGAAAFLAWRGLRLFAEAALLVAGLVFAAAIILVGQTYHLSGAFADAVFMFIAGAVGAAVVTGSPTLTVLALAAGGYWTWLVAVDNGVAPHWGGLVVVVIGGTIATYTDAAFARIAAIVALAWWIAVNVIVAASLRDWPYAGMIAVLVAIALTAWSVGGLTAAIDGAPRVATLGSAILVLGLLAILLSVGALQPAPEIADWDGAAEWLPWAAALTVAAVAVATVAWRRRSIALLDAFVVAAIGAAAMAFALWHPEDTLPARLAGAAFVIGVVIWTIHLGQSGGLRGAQTIGLIAFGVEVLYLYVITLGTLMDTALAFLGGGVLFIVLAFGLYRLDRRLAATSGEPPS